MDRVDVLCAMDRFMMKTFGERTVQGLRQYTLFRLALPPFQSFLAINVDKEVEKDRRVIRRSAEIHRSGHEPARRHVEALLQEARQIDADFVRRTSGFPIDIHIRYEDIEHHRRRRIELMLHACHGIFAQWPRAGSFRGAVSTLYDEPQFRELLETILGCYAKETGSLSGSVRIPHLFAPARHAVTQTVTGVMRREAGALSRSLAGMVYRHR